MTRRIVFALLTAILVFTLAACAAPIPVKPSPRGAEIASGADGSLTILSGAVRMRDAGITPGDSVDLRFFPGGVVRGLPVYSGAYAPAGAAYLLTEGTDVILVPNGSGEAEAAVSAAVAAGARAEAVLARKCAHLAVERGAAYFEREVLPFFDQNNGLFAAPTFGDLDAAEVLASDLFLTPGGFTEEGEADPSVPGISQPIPVRPGRTYYLSWENPGVRVLGAFFDVSGSWTAPLTRDSLREHRYHVPNGIAGTWRYADEDGRGYAYMRQYCFTAPAGAAYVRLHVDASASGAYRAAISSKPVYFVAGRGNLIWRPDDPLCAAASGQRLCVIGQSGSMIDRCLRLTAPGTAEPYQFISGYQEELGLWFKEVVSYGYSGKGYMKNGSTGIYDYVIGGGLDLTGFDVFLLGAGGNGLTLNNIGAPESTDPATYCGAVNALIDYIRSQCPQAKIYLTGNFPRAASYENPGGLERVRRLNEAVRSLAEKRGGVFMDLESESGFTLETLDRWTYDGIHANQIGSRVLGAYYRSYLVGF